MANTLKFGNGNWATKEDSVLAYNDENNNFKPLPFDFTRASTATYVDSDGLIKTAGNGEPRIDYTDNTDGALLLEPSRSNIINYSEDLTATGWGSAQGGTGISPTRTANYGIAPDGNQTATRVQFNLNGGTSNLDISYIAYSYTATGVATTNSIYMKSLNGIADVRIRCGSTFKEVDVTTEWQRFDITDGATSDKVQVLLYGNLSSQSADLLIWGVQAEQGSYATSYIPTSGSEVTRVAEVCNNGANEQVINSAEGVLFFEMSALANDLTSRSLSLSSSSYNNRIELRYHNVSNGIRAFGVVGNVFQFDTGTTITLENITNQYKFALKYKQNDFALWVNGVEVYSDLSGSVFPEGVLYKLNFSDSQGASSFFGKIKDTRVYNTALTDQELAALTS